MRACGTGRKFAEYDQRGMIEIFHTLAYASTIRNSVTGPLRKMLHQ